MSIGIKDVVSLTGSPGLHQIIKADDRAIIIESLDERKRRQMVRGSMMVSKLIDVSIYTSDDSEPLAHILQSIQEKYGTELPVNKKSSKTELMDFLETVLPDYDRERVYPSNVKKLVGWYKVLSDFEVDLNIEDEDEAAAESDSASASDTTAEAQEDAAEESQEAAE